MTDNSKEKAKFSGKHDPKKYIDTEPTLNSSQAISEEMLLERAALTMAQRRKRAMTMRRYKNKMVAAKARMAKRRAPEERLQVRARKKALSALKARLIGGRQYGDLTTAEKIAVDKRAERIPATLVARIAQKLLPKVRQAETERLKSLYAHMNAKNESVDLNEEFESFLEEKRYHNLLNKDETVKTDKRFKIYRPKKNVHFTEELKDLEESVEGFLEEVFIKNLPDAGPKPVRVSTDHSKVKLPETGTLKTLNDIFKKEGWSIVLHKGPGYFYFEDTDPNGIADTKSVMTYKFSNLPFRTWYEDGKAFYKSLSEMNIDPRDREEGTDSLVKMLKKDTPGQSISEMTIPSKEDTMGIQRRSMPQIKGEDVPHFLKFLKAKGINVTQKEVHPNDLKATQAHFNQDKIKTLVDKLKNKTLDDHPIITSNDDCVIDGHHRWLAHVNTDSQAIKTAEIDLPHPEVISAMKEYPRSFSKNLSEGVTADDYITPAQMKAFEKVVDQLFAKFKIDFKFTSHFGDRMVDTRNNPLVTLKDLAVTIKKLYEKMKKDGKTLSKYLDAEAVIKDLQNDLNIPIAVEYDRKNDELDVVLKTVMRKKKFLTPDPEIKV